MAVTRDCSRRLWAHLRRRSDERPRRRSVPGLLAPAVAAWLAAWLVNRSLRAVTGPSMRPTLETGDRVLVLPTWLRPPRRGDVVVALDPRAPRDSPLPTVKRLVGLAGETVTLRPDRVEVDGRRVLPRPRPDPMAPVRRFDLGPGERLLLGDNPPASTDSRVYGPVGRERLRGVVVWRVRPWGAVGRP